MNKKTLIIVVALILNFIFTFAGRFVIEMFYQGGAIKIPEDYINEENMVSFRINP